MVSFFRLFQGCPDVLTLQIIYQTLNGVAYCHSEGALHRDIKPENILITAQGQVKLCDFGFARMLSPGENYTDYVGEFLLMTEKTQKIHTATKIYSQIFPLN